MEISFKFYEWLMIGLLGIIALTSAATLLVVRLVDHLTRRKRGFAWAKAAHASGLSLSFVASTVDTFDGEFREGVGDYLEQAGHPDYR